MNKNRKQKGAEAFCITVILIFLLLLEMFCLEMVISLETQKKDSSKIMLLQLICMVLCFLKIQSFVIILLNIV